MKTLDTLLEDAEMDSVEALLGYARERGWTKRKLADALGVNDRTMRRWATRDVDIKLLDYMRLADLLRGEPKRG